MLLVFKATGPDLYSAENSDEPGACEKRVILETIGKFKIHREKHPSSGVSACSGRCPICVALNDVRHVQSEKVSGETTLSFLQIEHKKDSPVVFSGILPNHDPNCAAQRQICQKHRNV
jgi:hypothetical protein